MRMTASLLLILLATTACGKRGTLIYPEMVAPAAPTDVSALQTGSEVRISFQLPQKDIAGRSLSSLAGVNLFKQGSDNTQSGETCMACSPQFPPFKTVYLDHPCHAVQRYEDRFILLDNQVDEGVDYAYFVQSFLHDGTFGPASSPVKVSVFPTLQAPLLKAVSEPTEILLELSPHPSAPGSFVGFSIYRSIKGQPFSYLPYTKEPVTSSTFIDFGLNRQVVYLYQAKTIIRMPNGVLVESAASEVVEVQLSEE